MAASSAELMRGMDAGRWTAACAVHLLNRAGFGGTAAEIQQLASLGPRRAVEWVVDYQHTADTLPAMHFGEFTGEGAEPKPAQLGPRGRIGAGPGAGLGPAMGLTGVLRDMPEDQRRVIQQLRQTASREKMQEMVFWWLDRMVRTKRPLEEKMTLFWHGLLVSSAVTVKDSYHLYLQNELYRKHAVGNFETLILAVSRDAAMLEYLNNDQNKKEHPNENYARELMELFTLGIGNYTEQDIKESARAFSGWTHVGDTFVFNANEHDTGSKTFLGRTGNFDGTDIVRIIFEQPAASRYLATRLLKFFAADEPPTAMVEGLAAVARQSRFEVSAMLKALFNSAWFYSEEVARRQIKSPVQLMVGSMRLLGVGMTDQGAVDNSLKMMGQELFNAPTVKGWDGGRAWINTSTLFARYNLPAYIVTGRLPNAGAGIGGGGGGAVARPAQVGMRDQFADFETSWSPQLDLADAQVSTSDGLVDYYLNRLVQDDVDSHKRMELIEFVNGTGDPKTHTFDPTPTDGENRVRSLVHLIMAMAEFQLC